MVVDGGLFAVIVHVMWVNPVPLVLAIVAIVHPQHRIVGMVLVTMASPVPLVLEIAAAVATPLIRPNPVFTDS